MNEVKCFKCGTTEGTIIKHHLKYSPESIVDCCRSCHTKIHRKIRKENLCSLSREETTRLSIKSCQKRTDARREHIEFWDTVGKNISLHETIYYDPKTGSITYCDCFKAGNGTTLPLYLI